MGDYDEFVADRQLHIPKLCIVERNDVVEESSDRALESLLLVQPFEHYFGEHSTSDPRSVFLLLNEIEQRGFHVVPGFGSLGRKLLTQCSKVDAERARLR